MAHISTQPVPTPRRQKAPTLRDSDWEPHRAQITELRNMGTPLKAIMATIKSQTGFEAQMRQYKSRISKWGLDKNIKSDEMKFIVMQRQQRKLVDVGKPALSFRVRGTEVDTAKIDRWMQSRRIPQDATYVPSPALFIPATVECYDASTLVSGSSRTPSQCASPSVDISTPITDASLPGLQPSVGQSPVATAAPPYSSHNYIPVQIAPGELDMEIATSRSDQPHEIQSMWENLFCLFDLSSQDLTAMCHQFIHCKQKTEQHPLLPHTLLNLQDITMNRFLTLPYRSIKSDGTLQIVSCVLEYFISMGCSLEYRDPMGRTVFLCAAMEFRDQPTDCMAMLIRNGADVHAEEYLGRGALHLVLIKLLAESIGQFERYPSPFAKDDEDWLVFLLEAGCDPIAKDDIGYEPIQYVQAQALAILWLRALARTKHEQGLDSARRILPSKGFWSEGRPSIYGLELINVFVAEEAAIPSPDGHRQQSSTLDTWDSAPS